VREAKRPFGALRVSKRDLDLQQGFGGHGPLQQLFAHHCDDNFSTMGSSPMFKQENALPRAKL
jgi:hypothetical protein